jgi:hypothetical protein
VEAIGTATFQTDLILPPFTSKDTILIRTALGHVFKVGKRTENGLLVSFLYLSFSSRRRARCVMTC